MATWVSFGGGCRDICPLSSEMSVPLLFWSRINPFNNGYIARKCASSPVRTTPFEIFQVLESAQEYVANNPENERSSNFVR